MAKTEEISIKVKAIYNDERTHRYSLSKTWDSKKSKALVIMKNPSSTEVIETDLTTMLVINNLGKLDYGSVTLCNLMSKLTQPYNIDYTSKEHIENLEEILKQAKSVDYIILAWGSYGIGNEKASFIQIELIKNLLVYKDKLMYLANPKDPCKIVHPLFPAVRSNWLLRPYENTETNKTDK